MNWYQNYCGIPALEIQVFSKQKKHKGEMVWKKSKIIYFLDKMSFQKSFSHNLVSEAFHLEIQ